MSSSRTDSASARPPHNALTIDVEEWFHILDYDDAPALETWEGQESRVCTGTDRLLEIMDGAGVTGTFFFLSWVAERQPDLVRRVVAAGHEIGTHGYAHRLVYRIGRDAFREDTRRARGVLEDLLGVRVEGYRAAGFSITADTPWAFDVLAEEGFTYDSSIFPARRAHGGFDLDRERPFRISGPGGGTLWEFPIVPAQLGPLRVAFAGGGYFRLWPLGLVERATRALNRRGVPVTFYLHPRELDPHQPRMKLPWRRRFKYYVNLAGTPAKLRRLLANGNGFAPLRELAAALERSEGLEPDPPVRL